MDVSFPLILAVWVLISGLDDLFVYTVYFWRRARLNSVPGPDPSLPEKPIAIWVPLWKEDAVIERMLDHNRAAIRYGNHRFFVGVYPNDEATQRAVRAAASRHSNVHVCVCPRPGPTSKADCLNSIHRHMRAEEDRTGMRFEVVLTHDAEDLIHPDSLAWVSRLADDYGMIQTPVLALPTPAAEVTHGVYCDDFAQFHTVELPVRGWLGGFIPSSGVGTAYRRDALDLLASAHTGDVFEPGSLTEDYENGFRLQALGVKQLFAPVRFVDGRPLATREYFPRSLRAAFRQRTRWITGIAFQAWRAHGWGGRQWYWFWRDRKGLIGNPLSLASNLYLIAVLAGAESMTGIPGGLLAANGVLCLGQLAARGWCTARVYGWGFALSSPVRIPVANLLNALAACAAAWRFGRAVVSGEALAWAKTDHCYPVTGALAYHSRRIGEILALQGVLRKGVLEEALSSKPVGRRAGEHLVSLKLATWDDVYAALSLQTGIPVARINARGIARSVARTLPDDVARQGKLIPLAIGEGHVEVATPEIPGDFAVSLLRAHIQLPVRYRLVTPEAYENLRNQLL